jgi:hypothetical protein
MSNPNAYLYFNGRKVRAAQAEADPGVLGFPVKPEERGKTAGQLWEAALAPLRKRLKEQGEAAWAVIAERFDQGYRARIRNHGHSCFLCEIVIRSQFHTTYEPEA